MDENLLLLCRTKPFSLLTDDEHDVWHWYCSSALPIANDKYKNLEVQSQQLMSSVISLSDETFIFSEIKQHGHLWAQIRLVKGKEACLEYNKRNIEKLKRKTPNHHLIEKYFDEILMRVNKKNRHQKITKQTTKTVVLMRVMIQVWVLIKFLNKLPFGKKTISWLTSLMN